MDKFKNKYRIPSARLQSWDYGWNGAYFITICTQNRKNYFGEMANKYWYEIPEHFPFVKLGQFVVMPNHIHGIVIIDKNDGDDNRNNMDNGDNVETQNFASLPSPPSPSPSSSSPSSTKNKFGPQSQNLASIIRGFKIGVTKNARKINSDFAWQPRFYDHIIRNEKSLNRINEYIINNPANWMKDKFYKKDFST